MTYCKVVSPCLTAEQQEVTTKYKSLQAELDDFVRGVV